MKKFLFSIALTITLGLTASAQFNNDAFFQSWDDNDRDDIVNGLGFVLPSGHGFGDDANSTPLGNGLLILTAIGAGYALKKKHEKKC